MNFDSIKMVWESLPPSGADVIEAMVRADCNENLAHLSNASNLIFHVVLLDNSDDGFRGPQVMVSPSQDGDGFVLDYSAEPQVTEVVLDSGPFAGKLVQIPKMPGDADE